MFGNAAKMQIDLFSQLSSNIFCSVISTISGAGRFSANLPNAHETIPDASRPPSYSSALE